MSDLGQRMIAAFEAGVRVRRAAEEAEQPAQLVGVVTPNPEGGESSVSTQVVGVRPQAMSESERQFQRQYGRKPTLQDKLEYIGRQRRPAPVPGVDRGELARLRHAGAFEAALPEIRKRILLARVKSGGGASMREVVDGYIEEIGANLVKGGIDTVKLRSDLAKALIVK